MLTSEGSFVIVNAFCAPQAQGNPAAVCLMNHPHNTQLLQRIAQEIASVEVVFVFPPSWPADPQHHDDDHDDGAGGSAKQKKLSKADFAVRFFTKNTETVFCGHAILAAAAAIWKSTSPVCKAYRGAVELHFRCLSDDNIVVVRKLPDGKLELSLKPTMPTLLKKADEQAVAEQVVACLKLSAGKAAIRGIYCHSSGKNLIVLLHSTEDLVKTNPERNAILHLLGGLKLSKLTLSAQVDKKKLSPSIADPKFERHFNEKEVDFCSRLFAPSIGIDEDVCSAASHAAIGLLWKSLLCTGTGAAASCDTAGGDAATDVLKVHQASARGGRMDLSFSGPRVGVSGLAKITAAGAYKLNGNLSKL